jgi:hypothetical protein
MNEMMILFGTAVIFGILSSAMHRDDQIKEQLFEDMKLDHLQTCDVFLHVNRNDAEKHIEAFYQRWKGIIDEWELSTRTAKLYKRLFEIQKARKVNNDSNQ